MELQAFKARYLHVWIHSLLQPVYECSQFKCHRYDNQSMIRRMDILKVTTKKVTVREADDVTGEEM